jgi:hypothetical protein
MNEEEATTSKSETVSASNNEDKQLTYPGPKDGISYPLTVIYCGGILN